jgi:hypothetical protein
MSMPLSREALSLLELMPQWQLRAHLQPVSPAAWGAQCKALLVAVLTNPADRRLWESIGRAMTLLGMHQFWSDAQLLPSENSEQALGRILQDKPGVLLVFGEGLKAALISAQPDLTQCCALRCARAISAIAHSAQQKRALFALLAQLKREAL